MIFIATRRTNVHANIFSVACSATFSLVLFFYSAMCMCMCTRLFSLWFLRTLISPSEFGISFDLYRILRPKWLAASDFGANAICLQFNQIKSIDFKTQSNKQVEKISDQSNIYDNSNPFEKPKRNYMKIQIITKLINQKAIPTKQNISIRFYPTKSAGYLLNN